MDFVEDTKLQKYYEKIKEWSAWYSGSSEHLLNYYLGYGRQNVTKINKYNLMNKGRFWEKDIHDDRSTMLHVPVASDIASVSADLLLSEMPDVKVSEAHEENADRTAIDTQDRLDNILSETDFYSRMLEAAETASALSGVFVKIDWETDFRDYPIITVAQPDNVIPEFKWGFLKKLTFCKVIDHPDSNLYYRYLQVRKKGSIENQLWKGTYTSIGTRIPLNRKEYTADMEDEINHQIPDLLARYIPNKKPNRLWRGSDFGQSDLSGIEGLMDAIDETYTNWLRDLRLARGRIIVPDYMLEVDNNGKFNFNIDQEVFTAINQGPSGEGEMTSVQFDIRSQQHQETAQELLEKCYSQAGYSPASFGMGEGGHSNMTATEVKAKESKSFKTRNKKAMYLQGALEEILEQMLLVDNKYFNQNNIETRPQVSLQDSVQTDPMEMADSINKLHQAQALSIDTKVRKLHPNWNENQIESEVDKIMRENGMAVSEPDDLV